MYSVRAQYTLLPLSFRSASWGSTICGNSGAEFQRGLVAGFNAEVGLSFQGFY